MLMCIDSIVLCACRSVLVFVHGDLTWDRLHLMISRSTTPELIKMVHKLEEFFTQQRTSSKRVLSAFGPMSSASKAKVKQKDEGKALPVNTLLILCLILDRISCN